MAFLYGNSFDKGHLVFLHPAAVQNHDQKQDQDNDGQYKRPPLQENGGNVRLLFYTLYFRCPVSLLERICLIRLILDILYVNRIITVLQVL